MVSDDGLAGDPDGLHPQQFHPADIGQRVTDARHLPVEYGAHPVADESEVAGLCVAVDQRDASGRVSGLVSRSAVDQPFQGGQRPALDAVNLVLPVRELALQVACGPSPSAASPVAVQVDGVHRRELFGHAARTSAGSARDRHRGRPAPPARRPRRRRAPSRRTRGRAPRRRRSATARAAPGRRWVPARAGCRTGASGRRARAGPAAAGAAAPPHPGVHSFRRVR